MARAAAVVTIRDANGGDARAIATVHVASWRSAYAGIVPESVLAELSVDERAAAWNAYLQPDASSKRPTFVAEREGAIVGFVCCGAADAEMVVGAAADDDVPPTLGAVYAIYLDESAWSTGTGSALLRRAVAELVGRGFTDSVLWVLRDNVRARRFYERERWTTDGVEADYVAGDASDPSAPRIPEVCYRRSLRD